ncbi:MAG: hypothetical protein M1831_003371 [Alyxoria varia]|nr:MAG: hypothetical protein M1831_003371 [Alyxoria varia]
MNAPRAASTRQLTKRMCPRRTTHQHASEPRPPTPLSRHCLHQTRQSSSSPSPTSSSTTASSKPATSSDKSTKRPPKTAVFFPGHGVHRHAMLQPWLQHYPRTSRPYLAEVDHIMGYPLSDLIETGTNTILNQTQHSQPAILATSILILKILENDFNFSTQTRIDAALGHSLGEFAALVAARYLDWRDALRLVKRRAEAMADLSKEAKEAYPVAGEGEVGMVALIVSDPARLPSLIHTIQEFVGAGNEGTREDSAAEVPDPLKQVTIANVNSKNQIVLSGVLGRIRTLLTNLREFGGHDPRAVVLKAESPFHNPLMQGAADVTKEMLYSMKRDNSAGREGGMGEETASEGGGAVGETASGGGAGIRETAGKGPHAGAESTDIIQIPTHPIPVIANITSLPFPTTPDTAPLKDLLSRQCVETVRWWDSIRYLDQTLRIRRWIGIGPGKVGRNLVGKEVGMRGAVKGGGVWGVTDPWEMEEMVRGLEVTEGSGEGEEGGEEVEEAGVGDGVGQGGY